MLVRPRQSRPNNLCDLWGHACVRCPFFLAFFKVNFLQDQASHYTNLILFDQVKRVMSDFDKKSIQKLNPTSDHLTKISDRLWVGSLKSALQIRFRWIHNIFHVISVLSPGTENTLLSGDKSDDDSVDKSVY